MKRILAAVLALVAALVQAASAELQFKSLSVTTTSQTYQFRPAEFVGLCNLGTDTVHYRLFWEGETTAAATTAYHTLPPGTAAAPYCFSVDKAVTQPAFWNAISIIAASGTATVHLQTE